MKKMVLLCTLLYPAFCSAQDANFCAQINSVVSKLFSDPQSMHGSDMSREDEFTMSTPIIGLQGATECEYSTSSRVDEGVNLIFFSYDCSWKQNRGTSPESALQQGAAFANGIAGCTNVKMNIINNNERTKWRGRIRSDQKSMSTEVRVPKGTKYQRISLVFSGVSE